MNRWTYFLIVQYFICSGSAQTSNKFNAVDWVNPLMGTQSSYELSHGNTYPAVALPWGMHAWTPQTGRNNDGWIYTYDAKKIRGFKQTHQPSPWMNDYGPFSLMPVVGKKVFDEDDRGSWFSHKAEIAKPHYYQVYLADYHTKVEITPTERAACFRIQFPKTDSAFLVVDAFDRGSYIKIIPEQNKIMGYNARYSRGKLNHFKNYFVIYFDQPILHAQCFSDKTLLKVTELSGGHVGALLQFDAKTSNTVLHARIASSFIGFEQAERNLKELGNSSFDELKDRAQKTWNDLLGRVEIVGGSEAQRKTFYSTLYRTMLFPMRQYERDENNAIIHYSPHTGTVLPGYRFGGTGFWDTFRALYPLLNLLFPSINREMQEGLINDYKEGGWLPEWSSPSYSDIMIGNNSASVVSDAYLKGIRGVDANLLYEALRHGAHQEGPQATGRKGASYYDRLGYVPCDVGINESAARSLEYAYSDFAISQLAKALKRPEEEIQYYAQRSLNYKHLFDSSTHLMRGKKEDGSFQTPFNPFKWGDAFTEGNSWHYTWSVFHDIDGLAKLMGGYSSFVGMLDSVFALPPIFDDSYYGSTIHEIREMQIVGMGQYAHGNQPIQHMIYLYNYAGQPWKTQQWVREVLDRLYQPSPDGYCGDEDNGQTSAWYVFSAMGIYPVCPATTQYVLGGPLFEEVKLNLENGKSFIIAAKGNVSDHRYVEQVRLHGKMHPFNWIDHASILVGGRMEFQMVEKPNLQRGTDEAAFPYSLSKRR